MCPSHLTIDPAIETSRYIDVLNEELGKTDALIKTYERAIRDAGKSPDKSGRFYLKDGAPLLNAEPASDEVEAHEQRVMANYYQLANLVDQAEDHASIGDLELKALPDPSDTIHPAFLDFSSGLSERRADSEIEGSGTEALSDDVVKWMAEDVRYLLRKQPDYDPLVEDASDGAGLPDLREPPVKDARTRKASQAKPTNYSEAELRGSLPPGVSMSQSGYKGKYSS